MKSNLAGISIQGANEDLPPQGWRYHWWHIYH